MNINEIELLVQKAKENNLEAKEHLITIFMPLILKTCKNSYIPGYEFEDIKNECCRVLLKSINLYDTTRHAFAGYAKRAILTNIYYLSRQAKNNDKTNPHNSLTFTGELESLNIKADDDPLNEVITKSLKKELVQALQSLTPDERDLITSVIVNKMSLTSYAAKKNLKYSRAYSLKLKALEKMRNNIIL